MPRRADSYAHLSAWRAVHRNIASERARERQSRRQATNRNRGCLLLAAWVVAASSAFLAFLALLSLSDLLEQEPTLSSSALALLPPLHELGSYDHPRRTSTSTSLTFDISSIPISDVSPSSRRASTHLPPSADRLTPAAVACKRPLAPRDLGYRLPSTRLPRPELRACCGRGREYTSRPRRRQLLLEPNAPSSWPSDPRKYFFVTYSAAWARCRDRRSGEISDEFDIGTLFLVHRESKRSAGLRAISTRVAAVNPTPIIKGQTARLHSQPEQTEGWVPACQPRPRLKSKRNGASRLTRL